MGEDAEEVERPLGESAINALLTGNPLLGSAKQEIHPMLSVDEVIDLARAPLEVLTGAGPERTTTTDGAQPRALLSNREQAVLRLVAEGLFNKQIATSLGMGERTVKARLTSAMNKLGVDNRAHAAGVAVQRGLL